jgi:tetratricopeptide (TPR) repeat protein
MKLSAQQDIKGLVRFLLSVPGLDSGQISRGLKIPPFLVLSTEDELEAMEMQATLEKFGAVCKIEADKVAQVPTPKPVEPVATVKEEISYKWVFILVAALLLFLFTIYYFFSYNKYEIDFEQLYTEMEKLYSNPSNFRTSSLFAVIRVEDTSSVKRKSKAFDSKDNKNLKKELVKNPYNDSIWKVLYENLEKQGDTSAAHAAHESYNRVIKAKHVLHNLAKEFGNDMRIDIKETAIHYQVSKKLTDNEFYEEAVKIRKNLNARFPGKDLIIENYDSKGKVQNSVTMKAER